MQVSKSRLRKKGICALVLGLVLLSLALVVLVQFRLGWDTGLDEVPLFFWIMYVPAALGWLSIAIYGVVTPATVSTVSMEKRLITDIILIDIMVFVVGAYYVGRNPWPAWTVGHLLTTSSGLLFLFQGSYNLYRVYREKRQRTA